MNFYLVVLLIALGPVPVTVNTEMVLTPYTDEAQCMVAGEKLLLERRVEAGKKLVYACVTI
jgi:hypothetical protein